MLNHVPAIKKDRLPCLDTSALGLNYTKQDSMQYAWNANFTKAKKQYKLKCLATTLSSVYQAIVKASMNGGYINCSRNKLAAIAGVSVPTIKRAITDLKRSGYIFETYNYKRDKVTNEARRMVSDIKLTKFLSFVANKANALFSKLRTIGITKKPLLSTLINREGELPKKYSNWDFSRSILANSITQSIIQV